MKIANSMSINFSNGVTCSVSKAMLPNGTSITTWNCPICGPIRKLYVHVDGSHEWKNVQKQSINEKYAKAKTEDERRRIVELEALRSASHRHISDVSDTVPNFQPPTFIDVMGKDCHKSG